MRRLFPPVASQKHKAKMNVLPSTNIKQHNGVARVFGIIGVLVGLHPLLARPATTSVGDYATLTSVIAASADGDTIILTNNITVSAEIAISGKGLNLQGNNYSISVPVPGLDPSGIVNPSPSAFRVFNISASGKTNTLQNLTILGGAPASAGGGILNNGGTLVLQSVTIAQSGGAKVVTPLPAWTLYLQPPWFQPAFGPFSAPAGPPGPARARNCPILTPPSE